MKNLLIIIISITSILNLRGQAGYISDRNVGTSTVAPFTQSVTQRYVVTGGFVLEEIKNQLYYRIRSDNFIVESVGNLKPTSTINPSDRIIISKGTGTLASTTLSDLAMSIGTGSTMPNTYGISGNLLLKLGAEPTASFAINTNSVMTVERATDSIASLQTQMTNSMSLKANKTTTLSLNGVSYDLDTGGSWTTPTVSLVGLNQATVTGSYPNYSISVTQTNQSIPVQTTQIVNLSISGQSLSAGFNTITIPTQTQLINLVGNGNATVTGTYPNFMINSNHQIAQVLTGSGTRTIGLSDGGGTFILPSATLSIVGNTLSTVGGNTIALPITSQTVQPVNLSITGQNLSAGFNTITIPTQTQVTTLTGTNGSTVTGSYPNFTISSTTQSLQPINLSIDNGSISAGSNTIAIPIQTVATTITGSNAVTVAGTYPNFSISVPNQTLQVETQSLSINSNSLSIKSGTSTINTIVLPSQANTTLTAGKNISIVTGTNGITYTIQASRGYTLYSATTNTLGDFTFSFPVSYSVTPAIFPSIPNQVDKNMNVISTNISTTGFTVNAYTRPSILSLPVIGTLTGALLGATTTPVSGQLIDVLIVEK